MIITSFCSAEDKNGLKKIRFQFSMIFLTISLLLPASIYAEIPLWALDYQCQFVDWSSGTVLKPELTDLVSENAVVFHENFNRPGDAVYFDQNSDSKIVHYLGFINQYFGGKVAYADPDRDSMLREDNFYHSTDPSTLTAWRKNGIVSLHWTRDFRLATQNNFTGLNYPVTHPDSVDFYLVERTNLDNGSVFISPPIYDTFFNDNGASAGSIYSYVINSVASGDTFSFTAIPDTVFGVDETGPQFWVEKLDYQERIYELTRNPRSNMVLDWPIKFYVDDVTIDPAYISIDVAVTEGGSSYSLAQVADVNLDSTSGALTCNWTTSSDSMRVIGGVIYRLHYDNPNTQEEIFFPSISQDMDHFVWSTINNRVMGAEWNAYMMNVEGESWANTFTEVVDRLVVSGVNPAGAAGSVITYNGIFMDSVMGMISATHNRVKPYEFGGVDPYRTATHNMITALCDSFPGTEFWANTTDMELLEDLYAETDHTFGFAGAMDENLVKGGNGGKELAQALWLFRGHPEWQNVLLNSMDYAALDDRIQALVAFLFVREQTQIPGSEKALFGSGGYESAPEEYEGNVNILPEQLIRFKDEKYNPFVATSWPTASEWGGIISDPTNADLITWLKQNTIQTSPGKFVVDHAGRSYAVMEYEVEDGLSGVDTEALMAWDLGPTPGPSLVSLSSLFPDQEAGKSYYRLVLNGPALVTEGGYISTESAAYEDTFTLVQGEVSLFFTSQIESPTIGPCAIYTLPPGTGFQPLVAVEASHWNGQKLAKLELYGGEALDGTDFGWPDKVTLTDDGPSGSNGDEIDGDGIYSWTSQSLLGVPVGEYEFSIVATGNDGLMKFGTIKIFVSEPLTVLFDNKSLETGDLSSNGPSNPYASAPIDYNVDGLWDLLITQQDNLGQLQKCNSIPSTGVPLFVNQPPSIFSFSPPDTGSTGIAVGEIGSGSSSATAILVGAGNGPLQFYVWNGSAFKDSVDAFFDPAPLDVFDAAWADYNNDSLLDLVVARSPLPEDVSGTAQQQGSGGPVSGTEVYLYRQKKDQATGGLSFERIWQSQIFPTSQHYSYEVSWCDVDGNQLMDIFVCDLMTTESSALFVNQGAHPDSGYYWFSDETTTWFPSDKLPKGVRSAAFLDYNYDGKVDLVTSCWAQVDNLVIYENSGSAFSVVERETVEANSLNGLAVSDCDGNGLDDVFVMPYYSAAKPFLLLNGKSGEVGQFDRFSDYDFGSGRVNGSVIADWNGDGRNDIYLGRPSSQDAFYFKNETIAGASVNHWVGIRLVGGEGENTLGLGSYVEPVNPGLSKRKLMLSNGGRNGAPFELNFPLGGYNPDTLSVKVTWPSGHVQVAVCDVDGYNTIEDDSYQIISGSVTSSYMPNPSGGTDWVFEWLTTGPAPASRDTVHLVGTTDISSPCYCGGVLDLYSGYPGVEISVEKESSGWRHTFVWDDGCCAVQKPACTTTFDVKSGNYLGVDSSANHILVKFKVCGSPF